MVAQQGTLTFDAEVGRRLEAIYSTPDAIARRRAVLDAARPATGEFVLDIGPGPGFVACEVAQLVGETGGVAALDNNPTMLAMTQHRASGQGLVDRLELHAGDASDLPFPDESFDLVVASQVFEYVSDIQRALAEAWRVLRPGGRLVVIDTDWDTLVIQADDAELNRRVARAWDEHLAHRTLPRRLPGLLREAGFELDGVDLVPVINTEFVPSTYGFGLIGLMAGFAPGRQELDSTEVDAWMDDINRQDDAGRYFFSLNQYLFVAARPACGTGI